MTRRRDVARRRRPGAARCSPTSFAPVCTLVGKTWGAAPREGRAASTATRTCAMIADSVAFLVARGQARRLRRRALLRRLARRPRLRARCLRAAAEAGAENADAVRHQRRVAARTRSPTRCARCAPRSAGAALGIHCHNDAECGVANSLAAVAEGATLVQGTMNGYGERCGNANLVSIVPNLQLKLGPRLPAVARRADRGRALPRRAAQPRRRTPTSRTWARTPSRTRAGMHVAGVNADPATFEHIDPARGRQQRARC